mmetsp:Transcript_142048/g.441700  ORF Transcript_142048/g.441700 Transcript_142048/m.441700 type:complete len:298 (+) Transcript_142048:856-1749(+)
MSPGSHTPAWRMRGLLRPPSPVAPPQLRAWHPDSWAPPCTPYCPAGAAPCARTAARAPCRWRRWRNNGSCATSPGSGTPAWHMPGLWLPPSMIALPWFWAQRPDPLVPPHVLVRPAGAASCARSDARAPPRWRRWRSNGSCATSPGNRTRAWRTHELGVPPSLAAPPSPQARRPAPHAPLPPLLLCSCRLWMRGHRQHDPVLVSCLPHRQSWRAHRSRGRAGGQGCLACVRCPCAHSRHRAPDRQRMRRSSASSAKWPGSCTPAWRRCGLRPSWAGACPCLCTCPCPTSPSSCLSCP